MDHDNHPDGKSISIRKFLNSSSSSPTPSPPEYQHHIGFQQPLYIHTALSETSGLSSPVSPEFDSITGLPSPVVSVSDISSPTLLDAYSSVESSRIPKSPNKSYGSLTSRPSSILRNDSLNLNNRVISEYPNQHCISPPKSIRNISSPLQSAFSAVSIERESQIDLESPHPSQILNPKETYFEGKDIHNNRYKWRQVKQLGKGNFSTVVLAESISLECPSILQTVAIKIVLLPGHKNTKNRVESSLKRELELLKIIRHPSIINLLALNTSKERILIILPYLPGGDLFELATKERERMSPLLIRRIFAEIAIGVSYLHHNNIVHRDIKLENILLHYDIDTILSFTDFRNKNLISITDFGLARRIDPNEPLLTTRCGSEDYVPPELLIGLAYDGRQTDSWALGVLLYSIMEGRLPFDPPPNKSLRGRIPKVAHRIARIDWTWFKFDDEFKNTKWQEDDWSDAKEIVQSLLVKRERRLTSKEICEKKWVNDMLDEEFKVFKELRDMDQI